LTLKYIRVKLNLTIGELRMIILNILVSVIIMALVIWVAKLKTDLNIERMKVDTYRYYSLKLNHQIRGIK
tara:strand:- start:438 stop:647 length:210 start_codon:yes stop_codon:yes gene_type:complete